MAAGWWRAPRSCARWTAAPIGARAKRAGRSYTFAAGVLIILIYFIVARLAAPTVLPSLGEMILRAQAPNIALVLLGSFLVWRVDRV